MFDRKVLAVLGAFLASASVWADRVVAQNLKLEADADWRGEGLVTVSPGATLDLNGHVLTVASLAGTGTISNGRLTVDVPTGKSVTGTVNLAGSLRLVKAGAGLYLAAKGHQAYTGGTEVQGGTFRCGGHGALSGDRANSDCYGTGPVTVREGAVFDCDGWANHVNQRFVLDGGTIQNEMFNRRTEGFAWFSNVVLTKNSTMKGGRFGFVGLGWKAGTLDLQGHTLALEVTPNRAFFMGELTITGGGCVSLRGSGSLYLGGNEHGSGKFVKAPETMLEVKGGAVNLLGNAWGERVVFKDISFPTLEEKRSFMLGQLINTRVLPKEKALSSSDATFAAVAAADDACDAKWRSLQTKEEFYLQTRKVHAAMRDAIGGFPTEAEKCPLNPVIVGKVQKKGYHIEKLYFESWPGVYVPANLFVPDGLKPGEKRAGILVPCGHTNNGKGADMYQRACVVAVNHGFVVLIFDPFSQGERKVGGLCAMHNQVGSLAALLGGSMARYRIWDAMRALDYLESRPEVDADRLGCMGQSGGGTMTSLMMSVEPRLKAACPCCFISRYYNTVRRISPGDAEQNVFGMLPRGINYTSMILMQAPLAVRLLLMHQDFFPFSGSMQTFGVVQDVVKKFGLEDHYDYVSTDGPHDWPESERWAASEWMRRWLDNDPKALKHDMTGYRALDKGFSYKTADIGLSPGNMSRIGDEAVCPGRHVRNLKGSRTPFDVLKDELAAAVSARGGKPRKDPATVRRVAVMGELQPKGYARRELARTKWLDVTVVKEVFVKPDGFELPSLTLVPPQAKGAPVVLIGSGLRPVRQEAVREFLAAGRSVRLLDLFATGEIGSFHHRFYGSRYEDEENAVLLYSLGKNLPAVQAEELGNIVKTLKLAGEQPEIVAVDRICIAAALARGAYPDVVTAVTLKRPPNAWAKSIEISESIPFSNIVNGALKSFDWVDLVK